MSGRARSASKKLLKELPSEAEMRRTLQGLFGSTDQVVAISGAAFVDFALELLLTARFRPLTKADHDRMFDGAANGILGNASARIRVAYAIRLITDAAYSDMLLINDIRNTFAHTLHEINFNHDFVRHDCAQLQSFTPGPITAFQETAKQRYVFVVLTIYGALRQAIEKIMAARQPAE